VRPLQAEVGLRLGAMLQIVDEDCELNMFWCKLLQTQESKNVVRLGKVMLRQKGTVAQNQICNTFRTCA
jgi:hypothetical protein